MNYLVIYEKTGSGYSCYAPDLLGCIVAGDDLPQNEPLMEGAIKIHLAGEPIPPPSTEAA